MTDCCHSSRFADLELQDCFGNSRTYLAMRVSSRITRPSHIGSESVAMRPYSLSSERILIQKDPEDEFRPHTFTDKAGELLFVTNVKEFPQRCICDLTVQRPVLDCGYPAKVWYYDCNDETCDEIARPELLGDLMVTVVHSETLMQNDDGYIDVDAVYRVYYEGMTPCTDYRYWLSLDLPGCGLRRIRIQSSHGQPTGFTLPYLLGVVDEWPSQFALDGSQPVAPAEPLSLTDKKPDDECLVCPKTIKRPRLLVPEYAPLGDSIPSSCTPPEVASQVSQTNCGSGKAVSLPVTETLAEVDYATLLLIDGDGADISVDADQKMVVINETTSGTYTGIYTIKDTTGCESMPFTLTFIHECEDF